MTQMIKNGMKILISQLGQLTEDSEEIETDQLKQRSLLFMEDIPSFLGLGHVSTSMTYIGPAVNVLTALQITSIL